MSAALLVCLLASATAPQAPTVRVLYDNPGRMESTLRCHASARCGDSGDHVLGLIRMPGTDGLTAVNFASRWLAYRHGVVVADLFDPVLKRWVRQRLTVTDWQQAKDATRAQVLETDYETARRLHFVGRNTVARIVRMEWWR